MRLSSVSGALLATVATCVLGKGHDAPEVMNQIAAKPFTACIDDGDCVSLGDDHACFQYICYPWKDDSSIPQIHRKQTCKKNDDCSAPGETCFRHHNRRNVNKGICVKDSVSCEDGGHNDCPERRCCGGQYCCEEEYYKQLTDLPCTTHYSCNDLQLGQYCCNRTNTFPICCDINPNPPPPTTLAPQRSASKTDTNGVDSLMASLLLLCVCVVIGNRR